ncbi:MAG: B12-binding domain-containing radical SAM protein, partial [Promethearchaeota archaeon]
MKILLIQPSEFSGNEITYEYEKIGRLKVLRDKNKYSRIITLPPLGLMYLATPMLQKGHQVKILDAYTLQLTNGEIVQEAIAFQPDIIGISFYSRFIKVVYLLTQKLKASLNVPIVLGGAHPTAMPEMVLKEFYAVDYLIRGWGEYSISQLIEYLTNQLNINSVLGLCYRKNASIIKNPESALPKNLDDIPLPNRDLLKEMYDNHLYFNIMNRRKNMDVLLTSRNCPFSCRFCFQHWGGTYYVHTPDRVLMEIQQMVERGVNAIEIMDDNFTLKRKRVDEILDRIIERGFDLEFRIRSRVDSIDRKLLRKLKKAGTRAINYGMESGSDFMLNLMNKKTTVVQNEKACRLTKKAGILCQTSWLFGFPGETRRMLEETFRFVHRILPNTFTFCVLNPLPETFVYYEAKKNGRLVGDWSVNNNRIYVNNEEFPDHEAYDLMINKAHRKILKSFRYIIQTIKY